MSREAYEVLEKALVVLRERGLAKGVWHDGRGCVCVRGAVCLAATNGATSVPVLSDGALGVVLKIDRLLGTVAPLDSPFVETLGNTASKYNDDPRTTQADVEQLLLDAMSLALGEEAA